MAIEWVKVVEVRRYCNRSGKDVSDGCNGHHEQCELYRNCRRIQHTTYRLRTTRRIELSDGPDEFWLEFGVRPQILVNYSAYAVFNLQLSCNVGTEALAGGRDVAPLSFAIPMVTAPSNR